jgi:hypothetical protein
MMIIVIPDVTQCSLVDKFKCIVGTCYLHLQGRNINYSETVDSYAALILLSGYVALLYLFVLYFVAGMSQPVQSIVYGA